MNLFAAAVCRRSLALMLSLLVAAFATLGTAHAATMRSQAIPQILVADFAPYPSWQAALAGRERIDDERDSAKRDATTLAYAVLELKTHLEMLGTPVSVARPGAGVNAITIRLDRTATANTTISPISFGSQAHRLTNDASGITISAETGVGALYGVYSLLEEMGFDWPDAETTFVPDRAAAQAALARVRNTDWTPAQEYRGFWIYEPARKDDAFLVWMARKKFNIGPAASPDLRRLLGIYAWGGGHHLIEEVFSEKGLFERHPDWFARIRFFKRPVAPKDSQANPAFTSKAAAIHFADRLAERLEHGDLKAYDIVNVWQVDAFGRSFDEGWIGWWHRYWHGNEADVVLVFYANVVDRLAEHMASGRLSRRVIIAGASYRQTMVVPRYAENARRLEGKAYLHVFYPLDRDWSPLSPAATRANRKIVGEIGGWRRAARLAYGAVDYHNMSKYGGLALSDYRNFADNHAFLSQGGLSLFAYMHVASGDPGPRRLTHKLASRLGWERQAVGEGSAGNRAASAAIVDAYFARRFKDHAVPWQRIYALAASATQNANAIFGMDSLHMILIQHIAWADPVYSPNEARPFIGGFLKGGRQMRPGRLYGGNDYHDEFIGVDRSIALLDQAIALGRAEAARTGEPLLRRHMESDLAWFESTLARYRAIRSLGQFVLAKPGTAAQAQARSELAALLDGLDRNPHLGGTLSPVNQKDFIPPYRQIAGLKTGQ